MPPPVDHLAGKTGRLLAAVIAEWVADPESDVEYAELVDRRWAVRMRQTVRDATTVWWEVGDRTVRAEAYVIPLPDELPTDALRVCLLRNADTWRVRWALDRDGALVIRSRVAVQHVTREELDAVLGEIYSSIESTFRVLVGVLIDVRERSR